MEEESKEIGDEAGETECCVVVYSCLLGRPWAVQGPDADS